MGLRLCESTYRPPAHLECLSHRPILDVLSDARQAYGTSAINVRLDVKAPQAWLQITHDGSSSQPGADAFVGHPFPALGAEALVQSDDSEVVVSLARNGQRPIHSEYLLSEGMRRIR